MTTALTIKDIVQLLHFYKVEHNFRKSLYSAKGIKSFINRPFPADISENLVKFFIEQFKEFKGVGEGGCEWTVDKNCDLYIPKYDVKIEVKAFTNNTEQITFTCSQGFDVLYVLDCREFLKDKYLIHIFHFSSTIMQGMSVGMDCINVKYLSEDKRTIRVSLKRLMKFAKDGEYTYDKYPLQLDESLKIC